MTRERGDVERAEADARAGRLVASAFARLQAELEAERKLALHLVTRRH